MHYVYGIKTEILEFVSPEIRHTHLPPCCSNMLCSVLSQTLYHDASPQRRGHRQRSLCQERRESPCSSKVPCLVPGQRGHGPQSSHGDCVQTTCKHKGTIKGSGPFWAAAEGCENEDALNSHCGTAQRAFLQEGIAIFSFCFHFKIYCSHLLHKTESSLMPIGCSSTIVEICNSQRKQNIYCDNQMSSKMLSYIDIKTSHRIIAYANHFRNFIF